MKRVLTVSGAALAAIMIPVVSAAAAEDTVAAAEASAAQAPMAGFTSLLRADSLFGLSVGAVLWLSIAVIAAVMAMAVIRRGKQETASPARGTATVVALPDIATAVS